MAIKIQHIQVTWNSSKHEACSHKFLTSHVGSYAEFGMGGLQHCHRHYYVFGHHFLSIRYLKDDYYFWVCRKPWTNLTRIDPFREAIQQAWKERKEKIMWICFILHSMLCTGIVLHGLFKMAGY